MSLLLRWDIAILRAVNSLAGTNPGLDALMRLLSFVGTGGAIFLVLAGLLFLDRGRRRAALHVVGAMALSGAVEELLKALLLRPRPPLTLDPGLLRLLTEVPTSSAFPSGHTTVAFAAAAALWQHNRALGIAAGLLAVAIAFSRVYLGLHYPSDVLGGALLGIAGAALLRKWLGKPAAPRRR